MSATDGVDPLNSANLIHKLSDDSTSGSLTYINKNVKLTASTLILPFYYEQENVGGRPLYMEWLYVPIVYPMILLNDPASHSFVIGPSANLAEAPFIVTHSSVFKKQRGCIVALHIASPSTNIYFYVDGSIVVSGF